MGLQGDDVMCIKVGGALVKCMMFCVNTVGGATLLRGGGRFNFTCMQGVGGAAAEV